MDITAAIRLIKSVLASGDSVVDITYEQANGIAPRNPAVEMETAEPLPDNGGRYPQFFNSDPFRDTPREDSDPDESLR